MNVPPPFGRPAGKHYTIEMRFHSPMPTTITLAKETRDRLMAAKLDGGYASLDALVRDLLAAYRQRRLREASDMLRRRAKEKGLTLKDLVR